MLSWVLVAVYALSEIVVTVSGVQCMYRSGLATRVNYKVRECPTGCCPESYEVCCMSRYGVYAGVGIGAIVVLGLIILCLCCKERILAKYHNNANTHTCTYSPSTREENIPSVSVSVDPIIPPPYDALPPPYYTNQIEMGENSESTKDKNENYPDYPPPVYTEYTETTAEYTETAPEHTETATEHTETTTEHTEPNTEATKTTTGDTENVR